MHTSTHHQSKHWCSTGEPARALLEPAPSTTLPTRSSIEVAEALLEPPPPTAELDGDSDGPESLTVISEVKKGAAASESLTAMARDT